MEINAPLLRRIRNKSLHVVYLLGGLVLLSLALSSGCVAKRDGVLDDQLGMVLNKQGITPLDPGPVPSPEKVALGQALFFDKELSGNRDVSCATCHHPFMHTGDSLPVSIGVGGVGLGATRVLGEERDFIPRNAPDIFNRGSPEWISMFWDSRVSGSADLGFYTPAKNALPEGLESILAAQAMFPVTSEAEMRGSLGDLDVFGNHNELARVDGSDLPAIWDDLMERLLSYPEYEEMFQKAYPDVPLEELGFHHAANAIAAFEIHAWTFTDSPWDLYLNGDKDALSKKAKRGALLFYNKAGCSQCHSGTLLTDQLHHNIGVLQLGPGKGASAPFDEGRALETGDPNDKFAFRTPPLRNVTLTGPWMHNGAFGSLEEAVLHHLNPVDSLRKFDPEQLMPELQATCKVDEASISAILQTLDPKVKAPLELTESEFSDLMTFLNALTSPSALDLRMDIPLSVPSGLPIDD